MGCMCVCQAAVSTNRIYQGKKPMSREERKYRMRQSVKADLAQMTFGANGVVAARARVAIKSSSVNVNKQVFCPFCLSDNIVQKFLVSGKKGISQSKALCPACGVGMMLRNVIRKWTPESYAEWAFGYAKSGFWQKIKFADWNKKLAEKGWAQPFWDRYKALKGTDSGGDGDAARQYDEAFGDA